MGKYKKLTDEEIHALREEMRQAGEWAKQALKQINNKKELKPIRSKPTD